MNEIEHVVVLMMENRSFDHLLGFLDHPDLSLHRLKGTESNIDTNGNTILVSKTADGKIPYDPHHRHEHVCVQLTKNGPPLDGAKIAMNGFALDASAPHADVMKCFDPAKLPVLSTLAREYVVCDQWFSSVPGQTWPNRHYAHAGHSGRRLNNSVKPYGMPTIFDRLDEGGTKWRVYHTGLPQVASFWKLWLGFRKSHFFPMKDFYRDAASGTLPAYSFIEPKHMGSSTNSQHPSNNKRRNRDFLAGEDLVRRVYQAVAGGPKWNETLLLITWDEHGGFYDHETPIPVVSPHPGQEDRHGFHFDFKRSGVRVPTVIVSARVERAKVDHTPYDHSSIAHSLRERFADNTAALSEREGTSNTFWHLVEPSRRREDAPELPLRVFVNKFLQFVHEVLDRFDRPDESPDEDDLDFYQLARDVDELLTVEESSEDAARARAIVLEETEREPPAETRTRTRAEIGQYVERVGERFHRRAEQTRLTGPPITTPRATT